MLEIPYELSKQRAPANRQTLAGETKAI